jgi:hypothetical protein
MCAQINRNPYLNVKLDVVLSLSGHSDLVRQSL